MFYVDNITLKTDKQGKNLWSIISHFSVPKQTSILEHA